MHHTETIISTTPASTIASESINTRNVWRISAMDIQRGVIMILMALSHSREFIGSKHYSNYHLNVSPAWLGVSFLDFFQQTFVEILVAGGFYMMMGIGTIFLLQSRLKDGWSIEKTCLYLVQRGGVLLAVQFTILQFFQVIGEHNIYVGVLFGLGMDLIFAALCLYLTYKLKSLFSTRQSYLDYLVPLALILMITLPMQLLMNNMYNLHQDPNTGIYPFLTGGQLVQLFGRVIDLDFMPVVWFPAVAFGLIIGQILFTHKEKSFWIILSIALLCLISFFLIRTANLYYGFSSGDYKYLAPGDLVTPAAYFSVSKYPPSITYFLWGVGINLLGICMWQLAEKYTPSIIRMMSPVKIIGQCALFFFVVHWFIYWGISLFLPERLTDSTGIVSLWLLGIIPLYLMCKQYNAFKSRQPLTSKWRMF